MPIFVLHALVAILILFVGIRVLFKRHRGLLSNFLLGWSLQVLLSLPTTLSLAKAIQLIKGGSSRWIHETFPTHSGFSWQEAYGAFSIGVSGVEETIRYIESQEQHYLNMSFEDEFVTFLRKHGLGFDEKYVWG